MRIKIPFVGSSYQARSLNADAQRALNCYVEMDNNSPRAPIALYGTPGTVLSFTLPAGPVRNCLTEGGYTWWVSGNAVYRVSSSFVVTTIGSIGTSTGEVGMVSNGQQILIVDGSKGYLVSVATATMAAISSTAFPNGVKRAAYQDGYFIVTGNLDSQSFYINQTAYDGATWDALDFASAEGSPDSTLGVISSHRELWLFGQNSTEIWSNTGNADFPFVRSGNTFIEQGCAAAGTVAKADNTVFWLGSDQRGAGVVWRANGYSPQRISNHAMEREIQGYSTIADAYAFTYEQEGHIFYVLTFPTASKTWVYDAAVQAWHERAWRNPSTGALLRWRATCHTFNAGLHLVGDFETGNVYSLNLNTYTDNGDPILRLRSTIATENLQNRMFYSQLQVEMETGVGLATGQGVAPLLMLRYSNDGGHVWSNEKVATVGKVGEYAARAQFTRLGAGRNRVWEISMSDPVKFVVLNSDVDIELGTD